MSSGNPPVGSGYDLRDTDPDEPIEERRANNQQDRALPDVPMNAEQKVEQIVVREQGVNSFADAEKVDRMERPPSVNDRDQGANEGGNLITDILKGASNTLADTDGRNKDRG